MTMFLLWRTFILLPFPRNFPSRVFRNFIWTKFCWLSLISLWIQMSGWSCNKSLVKMLRHIKSLWNAFWVYGGSRKWKLWFFDVLIIEVCAWEVLRDGADDKVAGFEWKVCYWKFQFVFKTFRVDFEGQWPVSLGFENFGWNAPRGGTFYTKLYKYFSLICANLHKSGYT